VARGRYRALEKDFCWVTYQKLSPYLPEEQRVGFRTVHEIWGNEQRLEMADGRASVMANNACDGLGDLVTALWA